MSEGTLILYADAHPDSRFDSQDPINNSKIYPHYPVDGLTIARLSFDQSNSSIYVEINNLFPPRNRRNLREGISYRELVLMHKEHYRVTGQELISLCKGYQTVQVHIDPDVFVHDPDLKYFPYIRTLVYPGFPECHDPSSLASLISDVKPNFVGIFEYYLNYLKNLGEWKRKAVDGLHDFIVDSMPLVSRILLPGTLVDQTYLVDKLMSIRPITFYEVEFHGLGLPDPQKLESFRTLQEPVLTEDGRIINFQGIISNEQIFGVFLSHTYALATFNWK